MYVILMSTLYHTQHMLMLKSMPKCRLRLSGHWVTNLN